MLSVAVLVALSLFVVVPRAVAPVRWTVDGFFYQAQVYELQGHSQNEALNRAFTSPTARRFRNPFIHSPSWVRYTQQNYRRRWLVPALAAAITPLAGSRSLLYVSLLGYLLLGPALFALLRVRFSPGPSLTAAAVCLLLPPVRVWSGVPLTDSWGVTMTVVSLLAAYYAIHGGGRQLLWWVLAMLALSVTRDTVLVPIVGVALVAAFVRSRRTFTVLVTGVAASIPALVLFGTPLIREMAYNLNGFRPPAHPTLSYVASRYLPGLWNVVHADLNYPATLGDLRLVWTVVGVALALALVFMIVRTRRRDVFLLLQTGGLIGAALTVAADVTYTFLRVELVFLPGLAAALAFALSELNRLIRRSGLRRVPLRGPAQPA